MEMLEIACWEILYIQSWYEIQMWKITQWEFTVAPLDWKWLYVAFVVYVFWTLCCDWLSVKGYIDKSNKMLGVYL